MKSLVTNLVCAALLSTNGMYCMAQEIQVPDDAGNTIILSQPAQRIISLAPHITELLFAIGAGKKIVGVVEYSDYPLQAQSIRQIGNHAALDMEQISSLNPDLIVAWQSGNPDSALNRLRELGYVIFHSEPRQLIDVASTMSRLARLAGTVDQARPVVEAYQLKLDELKAQYAERRRITVFYEIWNQPMMTVNSQHIISEVIDVCGGQNVFARLQSLAPTVSVEPVLAVNPQVIIASSSNGQAPQWLYEWRQWAALDAVRYENLFYVNADTINRHTPRILEGLEQVCVALDKARRNIDEGKQKSK